MSDDELIGKTARCFCGIITLQVHFRKSSIPIQSSICHCSVCRHVSGEMAACYLPIEGPPHIRHPPRPVDPNTTDMTKYRISENAMRFFCSNCSAHMFNLTDDKWGVSSSSVSDTESIALPSCHIWVEQTMDGGFSDHLRTINGVRLPRYSTEKGSEELPMGWRSKEIPTRKDAASEDKMDIHCHCGANNFYITRPNHLSGVPRASYPDLIHPKSHTRLATARNPRDEKWWLSPRPRTASISGRLDIPAHKGMRYLAGHCVCTQCRTGGGFGVHSWAFVPRTNVFEVGSTEPLDFFNPVNRPKGLKRYRTSPGRFREFCPTCGATVLWWTTGRADVIDIAIGLLDERKDGVRAEEWLKWYEHLGFAGNTEPSVVVQGLAEGVAAGTGAGGRN